MGIEEKIVARTGAWFRYGEMQLGQGKEKARLYLKENPQITEEIKQKVLAASGFEDLLSSPIGAAAEETDGEEQGTED